MPRNALNQHSLEFWLQCSAASHVQGLASWLDQVNAHVSSLLARDTAFVFKGYFRLLLDLDCFGLPTTLLYYLFIHSFAL